MQKWEYYITNIADDWVEEELHTLGNDGWELVVVIHENGSCRMFFKRPKIDQ